MAYNLGGTGSGAYSLGYAGSYTGVTASYPFTAPYTLVDDNSWFFGQKFTSGSTFRIVSGPGNGTIDTAVAQANSLWGNDIVDIYTPNVGYTGGDIVALEIQYSDLSTAQWVVTIAVGTATISSVTVPANGSYKAGDVLSFTANFNKAVDVTGTPQLALKIGAATRQANYASGTGTSALVFSYTVQAGDSDDDGIAVTSLGLNGGTIKDQASTPNDATLTLNNVADTTGILVDTTAPVVTLLGDNPLTLENGTAYVEPGYTATDNQSGDITANVVITGTVDHNTDGSNLLFYGVTDAAGNETIVGRTVNVVTTVIDTTPDQFTLTDQTGVVRSAVIESIAITVSGVTSGTDIPVSITGGEYAVDAGAGFGAYTTAATNVQLGYSIKVRHTSGANYSTTTSTTLSVGGVSDTFSTTTLVDNTAPPLVSRQRVAMSLETTTIRMSL